MFTVGEFARLAQVSQRLLRYYDELGLLRPCHIDRFTSYRYYSTEQLPHLNRILALKELGLSLADRAAARLVLLTALASYQVDAQTITAFRVHYPTDQQFIEATAWASFLAARHVISWITSHLVPQVDEWEEIGIKMAQQTNPQQPDLLYSERFPRSSAYDSAWVIEHEMGPNVLWLTEYLCEVMDLRPGMRVLDLGCGKALSSIFLAREFGVQLWATDLWISATENAQRIRAANLADHVFPIHADARQLPFADEFFDAILSIDAFEYFGTDVLFLGSLVRLLKPGGQIGIVNAGLLHEVEQLPAEWPDDFCTFHTAAWWRHHWAITRRVAVEVADDLPNGRALWLQWHEATGVTDDRYLTTPAGENLTFNRIVGRRLLS